MKPKVWLSPGIVVIYGAALDVEEHKHNAIQIVWPDSECTLEVGNYYTTPPSVIGARVSHKLTMQSGLIILIEPQSDLGDALSVFLQGKDCLTIEALPPLTMVENNAYQSSDLPVDVLLPLWDILKPQWNGTTNFLRAHHLDNRIALLQTKLYTCFSGESMGTARWKASEVARDLSLSEGRFLHLFRQEMGISWRPYLLWRRLLFALSLLNKGVMATDAAALSGFSDTAHLSRTFRATFGLSIRKAVSIFR